ncbi:MAG: hypothetical protein QNJ98_10150 [Planctomycetota bacterium]|nr:hypothetical protein [Planctomycetota bacterium]
MRRLRPKLARLLVLACALALPAACRATPAQSPVPSGPVGPGARTAAEIPEAVHTARRLIREHQRGAALAALGEDRPLSAAEPERSWLLIAVWGERNQGHRARQAAQALPNTPFGAAMRSLAAESPLEALGHVGPWLGERHPWVHLAATVAYAQYGDHEETLAAATRALDGAPPFVAFDAHFARARAHMEEGRLAEAEAEARNAAAANPRDARGPVLIAEMERRRGELGSSVRSLLRGMSMAPRSESFPRRIAELMRAEPEAMPWDEIEAAVSRADGMPWTEMQGPSPARFESAERIAVRALVHKHRGRVDEAIATYQLALSRDAVPVPLERELRELLAERGRYAEVIDLLMGVVPKRVQQDPRNLLRPAWARLGALRADAPGVGADPAKRLELARTFVQLGALPEAMAVLSSLDLPEAGQLRTRVEGHLAFEQAMQREIEAGYRVGHLKGDPPSIAQVLARVRVLANTHLHPGDRAQFANPTQGTTTVPVIGTWVDHHTRTRSPVVAHFRRYGKFLMMGKRTELPTEAIVLSLASLTEQQPVPTPGGTVRHDVAIGYDRTLRGYIDAQGGALGGACLADGIWLDADSTRHAENDLRRALRLDTGLVDRARRLTPLPPHPRDGVFSLTDPGGVAVRLLDRYAQRAGDAAWGSFGTLEAHEGSHALDIKRHLPIMRGLPNTVSLLARNGFSPRRVEMELERRAQLGAVLLAPDPDLALAEMILPLPVQEREPEVHDGGYRDGLARMVRHIYARRDLYPQIDRTRRIVNQLDRLSNEQIRQAARATLRRK